MLPHKFLSQMAQEHQLSADQESVFFLRFGADKSDQEIALELGISEEAYRKRMGEIYRKFDIGGKGPGKHNRLLHLLQNQFQNVYRNQTMDELEAAQYGMMLDVEDLVQELRVRSRQCIFERCGTVRILDMSQPVSLEEIYTGTEVREKISSRRRLNISDLANHNRYKTERLELATDNEERISGMDALERYSKLMLLGKPGAGKTTLLKYVALQCSHGHCLKQFVPIFITLRQFTGSEHVKLIDYIMHEFRIYSIGDEKALKQLLYAGRALILLDGLDEIREEDIHRITDEIKTFSEQFYGNHFVITSRLAAREYVFEKFTEVEVANFQAPQISTLARKWFAANPVYAERFLSKVDANKPIQELATNPLLLTLLCLVFEEFGDFPSNRSELYKEGLDVLLKKWDAKRNIERHQIYKNLSMQRKEDLLSQVAWITFDRGDYFFRQADLEAYIAEYIRHLPRLNNNEAELQLDSEAIIKSIESQHGLFVERAKGIYSFSHLTFQEYLAAREVVHDSQPELLSYFATKVFDGRWHDVFSLAIGMMRSADQLLQMMKYQADQLLTNSPTLQLWLAWVEQKAAEANHTSALYGNNSSNNNEKLESDAQGRAFYVALGRALLQSESMFMAAVLARSLALDLDSSLNASYRLELAEDLLRLVESGQDIHLSLDLELDLKLSIEYAQDRNREGLAAQLQNLLDQLPDEGATDGQWLTWVGQLQQVSSEYCALGRSWDFSPSEMEDLRQYDSANHLIWDCLHSDCYLSQSLRNRLAMSLWSKPAAV